jgi:hypothetical protein
MYRERFALTRNGNLDIELADLLVCHIESRSCAAVSRRRCGVSVLFEVLSGSYWPAKHGIGVVVACSRSGVAAFSYFHWG